MNTTPPNKQGLTASDSHLKQADWIIPQNRTHYTPADHATWKHLSERQIQRFP